MAGPPAVAGFEQYPDVGVCVIVVDGKLQDLETQILAQTFVQKYAANRDELVKRLVITKQPKKMLICRTYCLLRDIKNRKVTIERLGQIERQDIINTFGQFHDGTILKSKIFAVSHDVCTMDGSNALIVDARVRVTTEDKKVVIVDGQTIPFANAEDVHCKELLKKLVVDNSDSCKKLRKQAALCVSKSISPSSLYKVLRESNVTYDDLQEKDCRGKLAKLIGRKANETVKLLTETQDAEAIEDLQLLNALYSDDTSELDNVNSKLLISIFGRTFKNESYGNCREKFEFCCEGKRMLAYTDSNGEAFLTIDFKLVELTNKESIEDLTSQQNELILQILKTSNIDVLLSSVENELFVLLNQPGEIATFIAELDNHDVPNNKLVKYLLTCSDNKGEIEKNVKSLGFMLSSAQRVLDEDALKKIEDPDDVLNAFGRSYALNEAKYEIIVNWPNSILETSVKAACKRGNALSLAIPKSDREQLLNMILGANSTEPLRELLRKDVALEIVKALKLGSIRNLNVALLDSEIEYRFDTPDPKGYKLYENAEYLRLKRNKAVHSDFCFLSDSSRDEFLECYRNIIKSLDFKYYFDLDTDRQIELKVSTCK